MKKVLIITYYWPPSGGGGVQRWLKFAKYLPEFGWEPVIFTPENPDFDIKDVSLLKDVDAELEVLKLPIWEPYQLFAKVNKGQKPRQGIVDKGSKQSLFTRFALFVRGNFFIPDPRKFWVKPAVAFLSQYIKENGIEYIITTGPPHSIHLIGQGLKNKIGIKWLADFRDPWSKWDMLDNFHLTPYAKRRHRSLEKAALSKADEVVTVSESWAQEFANTCKRDYQVITNGYDSSDFSSVEFVKNEKFIISHFGLINNFRNPVKFWAAIEQLAESTDLKSQLSIRLYGTIDESIIEQIKSSKVLCELVEFKPPVTHDEVLKAYGQSDLLLLLLNDSRNAQGHIPGKLFEYMASQRPILALGPHNGDSARVISETNSGITYHWDDLDGIKDQIEKYLNGKYQYQPKQEIIEKYSRKNLTGQLAKILDHF